MLSNYLCGVVSVPVVLFPVSGWLEAVFSKDKFSSYTAKHSGKITARCRCCTRERWVMTHDSVITFVSKLITKIYDFLKEK